MESQSINKAVTLPSGSVMPLSGFGTSRIPSCDTEAVVTEALNAGFRHFDCAPVYRNERQVGSALKAWQQTSGVPRSELFVVSKLWNTHHKPEHVELACRKSLANLQVEYLDLYLIHHPFAFAFSEEHVPVDENGNIKWGGVSLQDTWRAMERLVDLGLVRNIGVSNYSVALLIDLLQYARIKPAVNQAESHVYNTRTKLRLGYRRLDVHFSMHSTLGNAKHNALKDPVVLEIAQKRDASPAQVLLAWGMTHGCSVLSKTINPKHMKENLSADTVKLTDEDMSMLDNLDKQVIVSNMERFFHFPVYA